MDRQFDTPNFEQRRKDLVENYVKRAGVTDERVIQAFLKVPRHEFVFPEYLSEAYIDTALPIGEGQTISQPSLVALMTQELKLKGPEKVLEIGTGSGYQAAILSQLAKEVYTVERIESLARQSRDSLNHLGYENVRVFVANGTVGLPKHAPFDAIIVTAGAKYIPKALIDQLQEQGRIVIPVGEDAWSQELKVGVKRKGKLELEDIELVRFVPLIGKHGWRKNFGGFLH